MTADLVFEANSSFCLFSAAIYSTAVQHMHAQNLACFSCKSGFKLREKIRFRCTSTHHTQKIFDKKRNFVIKQRHAQKCGHVAA